MKKRDAAFIGEIFGSAMETQFGKHVLDLMAKNPGKEIIIKIEIRDPVKPS